MSVHVRVPPELHEQQAFLSKAAENGAIAFVARSVADVFDVLDGVMRDLNGAKASAK